MLNLKQLNDRFFDRESARAVAQNWIATTTDQGVVASAHYLASAAGADMLQRGGNAIDAAAATSFALGVCEPAGSGLGGMATCVVYLSESDRVFTVEGPCLAPRNASPDSVAQSNRYRGAAAVAVPTHVSTMQYLIHHYGTQEVAAILDNAIQIAQEGFPVTSTLSGLMTSYHSALSKNSAGEVFLNNGSPFQTGEILKQTALATTLRRLAEKGLDEFYRGEMAKETIAEINSMDGFLDLHDLHEVPPPRERAPLKGRFIDEEIYTCGPPAGGLALVQLAEMFTECGRESLDFTNPEDVVLLARMIQCVRRERQRFRLKQLPDDLGDASKLLEREYNQELVRLLLSKSDGEGETSHISVVDRWGNAVSLTQSIERSFGSGVVPSGLGFCLNGYLRAYKVENKRHPYYLKPGIPARSNAAPSILFRNGKPTKIIGSTGSERMASGIFSTLLRLRSETPFESVHGPRFHCTPEGIVILEADRVDKPIKRALTEAGMTLDEADPYAFRMGGLQLIHIDRGSIVGLADPRRDGAALVG